MESRRFFFSWLNWKLRVERFAVRTFLFCLWRWPKKGKSKNSGKKRGVWRCRCVQWITEKTGQRRETVNCLVIQSDLFGMVKWPFKGLSDLQLGNQKVTLNHLVCMRFQVGKCQLGKSCRLPPMVVRIQWVMVQFCGRARGAVMHGLDPPTDMSLQRSTNQGRLTSWVEVAGIQGLFGVYKGCKTTQLLYSDCRKTLQEPL